MRVSNENPSDHRIVPSVPYQVTVQAPDQAGKPATAHHAGRTAEPGAVDRYDGLLPTNFQPVETPAWCHMSGHASIVRRRRRPIVTILRETQ